MSSSATAFNTIKGKSLCSPEYEKMGLKDYPLESKKIWPELESNQRHKDFQTSQVIAIPCLWLPQINQDSLSLQENFNLFRNLLEVEGE